MSGLNNHFVVLMDDFFCTYSWPIYLSTAYQCPSVSSVVKNYGLFVDEVFLPLMTLMLI